MYDNFVTYYFSQLLLFCEFCIFLVFLSYFRNSNNKWKMPQILRRRKAKRSQKRVLVKRRHFLTSFHETKSYKPCKFCEKCMFAIYISIYF